MYWEVCHEMKPQGGEVVASPYVLGYQMSRSAFSVCCYDPYNLEEWFGTYQWVADRLQWCHENKLKLAGLDEQVYVYCEGDEYKPVPGKRLKVLEFRFARKEDAVLYKLVWGGN